MNKSYKVIAHPSIGHVLKVCTKTASFSQVVAAECNESLKQRDFAAVEMGNDVLEGGFPYRIPEYASFLCKISKG